MASPRHVLETAVLHLGGKVGVAGTGLVPELGIVLGAGVGVFNEGGQRSTAGHIVHQAAEKLGQVGLLAGGGGGVLSRSPAL